MSALVIAGADYTFEVTVYDLSGTAKTGLVAGNFSTSLLRRTLIGTYAAAGETVSVSELGSGRYGFTFTAAADADEYHSYWLQVTEANNFALSREMVHDLFAATSTETTTTSEDDAFCDVTDVEARMGQNATTSTRPTEAELIAMMVRRAEQIEAELAALGYIATPDDGANPIETTSQSGRVLRGMARDVNALYAAGDYVYANRVGIAGAEIPERAVGLFEMAAAAMDKMRQHVRAQLVSTVYTPAAATRQIDVLDLGMDF